MAAQVGSIVVGTIKRNLILAVDPGLTGAMAVIDAETLVIHNCTDLPTFKKASKSRKSGHLSFIDVHALSFEVDYWASSIALAIIEEPGAMPKQGLSSTFRFGHVCGQIHGVLAGHNLPVVTVKPPVWKAALGLNSGKEASTQKAHEYFKDSHKYVTKAKHHDRAEALLLAYYASKYLKSYIQMVQK